MAEGIAESRRRSATSTAARVLNQIGYDDKGDGKGLLLVRINSSTQVLTGQELLDYRRNRWRT